MALVHALASCFDCGKMWDALNAQAVGAKHHYTTGHQVITEVCYSKTYLRIGADPMKQNTTKCCNLQDTDRDVS